MKLSQSNVIFFCLFAAFVVFITLRGELPKYLDVLFTTKAGGETHSASASPTAGITAAGVASDPIGAAAGFVRRSLGIENGLLGNLIPGFGSGQ